MKKHVPHISGVHGVAHNLELGFVDAVEEQELIQEVVETNQMAYTHYGQSAKKRLSFGAVCTTLGEENAEALGLHGIRWQEASFRACRNLIKTWRSRVTDLMEEAAREVKQTFTLLTAPELFLKAKFKKKFEGYPRPFTGKVDMHLGLGLLDDSEPPVFTANTAGLDYFRCQYTDRTSEILSKGEILTYLHEASDLTERMLKTKAGILYERLTRYAYVRGL